MTYGKRLAAQLIVLTAVLYAGAAQAEQIRISAFDAKGDPVSSVFVSMDAAPVARTDAYGTALLDLPDDGARRWLNVNHGGVLRGIRLDDNGGEVTDVRVTVMSDGALDVRIVEHVTPPPPLMRSPEEDGEAEDKPMQADVGPKTKLVGIVRGPEGQPVAGAQIVVEGHTQDVRTNERGEYVVDGLDVGAHRVSIVHPDFALQSFAAIETSRASSSETPAVLDVELAPAVLQVAAIKIRAPMLGGSLSEAIDARKNASAVTEVLSREDFSRSGDSSAASALKRVTGLTLVGGRYVYVRGLGERYSTSRLNGALLPSPEPERRVVPLDLFPSGVLESMTVHKSYSADLPGEFGGGVVDLKTRSIPDAFTARLKVGTGVRTGTTFTHAPHAPGGLLDFTGVDTVRALPRDVAAASTGEPLALKDRFSTRGYQAKELEAFGEQMRNVYSPQTRRVLPDGNVSGEVGGRVVLGPVKLGGFVGATYKNGASRQQYQRDYFVLGADTTLERGHQYNFDTMNRRVTAGGIAAVGAELYEHHKLGATVFLGRVTDDEARIYQGFNRDVGGDIRVTRLRFVERTLMVNQLLGEHKVPGLWDWTTKYHYTYALALRSEPDRRETRYDREQQSDVWRLSDRPEGNQRVFSGLTDHSHNAGLSSALHIPIWLDQKASVEAGLNAHYKTRVVDTRRFKFTHKGDISGDPAVLSQNPEQVFSPGNISSDGFLFEEVTRQTDNYDASQAVFAAYLKGALPLIWGLKAHAGVRVEHGRQSVRTFALFNPDDEPVIADLVTTDVLPHAGVLWSIFDVVKLRLDSSLTVSRPDFRELSPATFNDVTGGRQVFGNPELERALILSTDARAEWYPLPQTQLSVGTFYKHFHRPIEQIVVVSAQQSVTYQNAAGADNVGAEIEARTDFGWVHDVFEGAFVAANGALIYSRVDLGDDAGIATTQTRPLQGQSPFIFNLQAGYSNPERGTTVAMLYNVAGARIVEVGAQGAPDVIEQPFHQLDVTLSQDIGAGFSVGASARNLIDLPLMFTQGGKTLSELKRGRQYGLSLSWKY